MFDTPLKKGLAAVGVAAAGALIIAKPEQAWMVIAGAAGAALMGYIAGWLNDEFRNKDDDDGFA